MNDQIFETVVSTCSAGGVVHVAPMGVRYRGESVERRAACTTQYDPVVDRDRVPVESPVEHESNVARDGTEDPGEAHDVALEEASLACTARVESTRRGSRNPSRSTKRP